MKEPEDNRGSQALRRACPKRGDQARLALKTGISQTRISRLSSGGRPNLEHGAILKTELGIELEWWTMPPLTEPRARRAAGGRSAR